MRYAQKQEKRGFFINVTTVLPAFGSRGTPHGTPFGVSRGIPPPLRGAKRSKWQDRRIIPDYLEIGIALRETNSALVNGK